MAEVHPLPHRFNHEGAERLVKALEQAFSANVDLGPRWAQIRALGLSLQQLSRDLEQEINWAVLPLDTLPEAFRDNLRRLAAALTRLGVIAQAYPSTT
ncbi:hypothetical protein LOK46_32575 (plasmid) [Methylobacterium sp. NMS14P]|uniref:hypothetical protein n=1 Tax=Methylobacterium sp. NMS14P TaxID=2894310 RepID=UPI0023594E6C|nr:hypothetical protein [Methylobacterium sp. NMS14P]WCS28850.1 hypothetical protein LOK46_32575 [Methylobacterium sp. NMS14P]